MPLPRALAIGAALVVATSLAATYAWSQRGGRMYIEPNVPYDGKYAFARLRYTEGYRMAWSADYPKMERNFMTILKDLTRMRVHTQGSNVYTLDDRALGQQAVAYLTEPGYWYPNDREALGLRTWLQKGGFLIVDDFYFDQQWRVFEEGMRRVLPEGRIVPMDLSHPVFDTFFRIKSLDGMTHPATPMAKAQYLGIYEDNDPTKRLMVIINFNNDIGDYMEWSGEGWYPINFSNDAYKFATNYVIYGLTH
ncbi:MAG: DUF4159 domain-containing protein [Gemmatimonadetes bacterium]|nr:DUF4159 domain-containing protein [Gemmatimonadota bacterium]